jgi:calcineurin-like phosphoesterase family protein
MTAPPVVPPTYLTIPSLGGDLTHYHLWSDLHLGHRNIIPYARRPFETVEQMDQALLDAQAECLARGGILLNLGDVALGKRSAIHGLGDLLLLGNHDRLTKRFYAQGFTTLWGKCHTALTTAYLLPLPNGATMQLSHGPVPRHPDAVHAFYGHVHEKHPADLRDAYPFLDLTYTCVCVEHTQYRPRPLLEML